MKIRLLFTCTIAGIAGNAYATESEPMSAAAPATGRACG